MLADETLLLLPLCTLLVPRISDRLITSVIILDTLDSLNSYTPCYQVWVFDLTDIADIASSGAHARSRCTPGLSFNFS